MRPIASDVWCGPCVSMCRFVCDVTTRYPAETAEPIEMPFDTWGGVGHSNHVLDGGTDPPRRRDNFGVGKGPYHSKDNRE